MGISLYSGLPGAGKSFGVVKHVIVPALQAGRPVVTNLPLHHDAIHAKFPSADVSELPSDVPGWLDIPGGAVVVIDEAWRHWPSGLRTNKIEEPHREFFAMHRHKLDDSGRSQQIVLVTQNPEQLASFVRGLVEVHYRMTKLTALGQANRYRVDMFETAQLQGAKVIRESFGSYDADTWTLYQSHTKAQGDSHHVDESSVDRRAVVWKRAGVMLGIPLGLAALVFGGWSGVSSLRSGMAPSHDVPAALSGPNASVAPRTANADSARGRRTPGPQLSRDWRLAGSLVNDKDRIFAALGRGGLRYLRPSDCAQEAETRQWSCVVDGYLVTTYSGPGSVDSIAVAPQVAAQ